MCALPCNGFLIQRDAKVVSLLLITVVTIATGVHVDIHLFYVSLVNASVPSALL